MNKIMKITLLRYSQSGMIIGFDRERVNLIPRFTHEFRNVKKAQGKTWDVKKHLRWYSHTKMQILGLEFDLNIKCTK